MRTPVEQAKAALLEHLREHHPEFHLPGAWAYNTLVNEHVRLDTAKDDRHPRIEFSWYAK